MRDSVSLMLNSPIGNLRASANFKGITALRFEEDQEGQENQVPDVSASAHLHQLKRELEEYFSGTRQNFEVPLVYAGTSFQCQVWERLLKIPFGEVMTYREQALQLGNASAIRAIAHSNALNQLLILVPCHRIIGSNGDLTGYSGGLWRKKWLLEHEAKYCSRKRLVQGNLFGED